MPIHDRLDLQHWIAQFPLPRLRAQAREYVLQLREPEGEILVGPDTLAINEQLRAELFVAGYSGARAATDVFVWKRGEQPNREITKVGGVPYRPRLYPWPQDGEAKPLRFIAQLCFTDSRDIVGDLPGDVLLIFGDDDALLEPERLVFEWWPLGIDDLVSETPQATTGAPLLPYHGAIHRTEDWPDAEKDIPENKLPWLLAVFEGTKIGGLPRFIQGGDPRVAGRFLAALGSISGGSIRWDPPVGESEQKTEDPPVTASERKTGADLMIGDMGSLYLFLDPHGRVHAVGECY